MPRSSLSLPHHQGVEVRLHGHSTRWCAPCQPGTWGPGYGLSEEALTPTAEFFPVLVVVGFPSGPAIILSDFEGPELRSRWSDRDVLWCVGKLKAPASPWAPDRHRVSRGFPAVWPGGRQAHHHSSHDSRCSSKCPGLFLSTQVPAQAQSVRPGGGAPRSRGLSEPQTRAHVQWSCPEEAIQGGSLDRPGSSEAEQAGSPFPSVVLPGGGYPGREPGSSRQLGGRAGRLPIPLRGTRRRPNGPGRQKPARERSLSADPAGFARQRLSPHPTVRLRMHLILRASLDPRI